MKKVIHLLFTIIFLTVIFLNRELISRFVAQKIIYKDAVIVNSPNEYYKNTGFAIAENTNNFIVKEKDDFYNIIYTILNSGWKEFTFFCNYTYENCSKDFFDIAENTDYVETVNNYINPLNSYERIYFSADSLGKIKISVEKKYTDEQIEKINNVIDGFIRNNIEATMNDHDKIKLFHDFVANNTIYDLDYDPNIDKNLYPYHPYNAYGPLIEGKGICSGYSDAMAIFLDKIGVKNYRIISDNTKVTEKDLHTWNILYLNNNWYHLDLTWDDPVTSNGEHVILYDFYLITTEELKNQQTNKHIFNENLYLETK